ncbi:AAA family ATPase [Anaerolineae bacterium CFX8]|nr:AAA family ATPase [Anaerolineae bacterium CFX8]
MLTRLTIHNFKALREVDIELGQNVVFIGPNNSGKTTALQALALWHVGLQHWLLATLQSSWPEQIRSEVIDSGERGVSINRLDLTAVPIPGTRLLWNDLRADNGEDRPISLRVEGITGNKTWSCAFMFRYENEESLTCLPGQIQNNKFFVPNEAKNVRMAFLPSMSGLVSTEDKLERGSIERRISEGRTAEILRNLCYQIYNADGQTDQWNRLTRHIKDMFQIELFAPDYLVSRGEIRMTYRERGLTFDLSASGRGMLQVLLLLAYLYANPESVLLLDEPDAHLEIIRQREIYNLLTRIAREQNSQIIAASHSEVVLEEAANKDTAIAFLGNPHRIDKRNKSQVLKALKQIRAVDYYLAQQTGWVIYLEGATDLSILQTFARRLKHEAASLLEQAFVYYLEINKPSKAADHFRGLREASAGLVGVAVFDRISSSKLQRESALTELIWRRREIENYLIAPETLLNYARSTDESGAYEQIMEQVIGLLVPPIALEDQSDIWWMDVKASEGFLERLFDLYSQKSGLFNIMRKTNYRVCKINGVNGVSGRE